MRTRPHASDPRAGFSLVELLVALVFISLLMAGMLRIYGSAIQGFATANETMKAQRDNRWATEALQDDLQAAGYFYPTRIAASWIDNLNSGNQNPVMILPNQTLTNQVITDPNNPAGGTTTETLTFDELQFTTDQVLPLSAQLTAAVASGGGSLSVTATLGDFSLLQAGDFALIMDGQFEPVVVSGGPYGGSNATLTVGPWGSTYSTLTQSGGAGGVLNNHQAGPDVVFVRPYQVVRYTLLPMNLDPGNPNATVPCLVRDQTAYPTSGARIAWPAANANAASLAAAGVVRTVVAENVTGLRFDMSANQGQAWTRAASWPATQTNLNGQLATLAAANPGVGYSTSTQDPSNRLWYRNAPVLIRADLTTRTVVRRTEYAQVANTLAYRTRTQTLFVQPRNFGFGLGDS